MPSLAQKIRAADHWVGRAVDLTERLQGPVERLLRQGNETAAEAQQVLDAMHSIVAGLREYRRQLEG